MKKRNPNLLLSDKFADNAGFYPPDPHPHSQTFKIFETTLMRLLFANFNGMVLNHMKLMPLNGYLLTMVKYAPLKLHLI